ncbi:rhythmically expressed gene 2 protein-like [Macrosteles quadrilineatus]|uniref:rhythmically expressed gene 2 protein-like n=1 Tax=Macrosteles quadrilineatus TaxID=74068 RepID=UPI0023E0A240|nr:rhythmically expressed gene 2 protein-like [Macrosteles quadrilineatus]XP_054274627.1 rhythmically expressed gene 2 protein-like [Macrosteles quadrilineatus]
MILKLVTFDATGTLLQFRGTVGSHYAKIASKYSVNVQPRTLTKNFPLVFKRMLIEHPNFGANNGIGWQHWWEQLVSRVIKDSLPGSVSIESSTVNKISSDLIEIYSTKECWKLADGAERLLEELSGRKFRLGVISNSDPRLGTILQDLNIKHYFDFVTVSFSVNCEKPDSAIFKAVEDMNVGIKKCEILHIGDNPKLDFMGARNVGWNALLVANNSKVLNDFPSIEKDWVVDSIDEIYQVLENKNII